MNSQNILLYFIFDERLLSIYNAFCLAANNSGLKEQRLSPFAPMFRNVVEKEKKKRHHQSIPQTCQNLPPRPNHSP